MKTAQQVAKMQVIISRTGKPWDHIMIARKAKKLGAKYVQNKHGWALGITDEMIEIMKNHR